MFLPIDKLQIDKRFRAFLFIYMPCHHFDIRGKRIGFPVPIHDEVAYFRSDTSLYEHIALFKNQFALRLTTELRRTTKYKDGTLAVEDEIAEIADGNARLVKAAIRSRCKLHLGGADATCRLKRPVDCGCILLGCHGEAEIHRPHHVGVVQARRLHCEIRATRD